MRIIRRTSGGRGEYEVSGESADGIRARDLVGHTLILELPDSRLLNTFVEVTDQGSKARLRLIADAGADLQVQKQIAAAFLLPIPIRQDTALEAGEPVIRRRGYAVEHIEVAGLVLTPPLAVLRVSTIVVVNRSQLGMEVDLRKRSEALRFVWDRRGEFPDDIAGLLAKHESLATAGGPITSETERLVVEIERAVSDRSADLGIVYSEGGDVLESLLQSLNYQIPKPLIDVDRVDPTDLPLKERAVKEWKRWANARGPASARFKQQVRHVYRATCLVCGVQFPSTSYNKNPGVDAAHILPWSDYDLDEVYNGLCLCKLHHWAFDEGLLRIRYEAGAYIAEVPDKARNVVLAEAPDFSIAELERVVGPIAGARLPLDRDHWPQPALLETLYGAL